MDNADVEKANQFEPLLTFEWTWLMKMMFLMPFDTQVFFTGNQCLGGESLIYDPIKECSVRIDEIDADFHVYAWDGEKLVKTLAYKPFKRGEDDLFKITLSNSESFVASMNHKVLTPSGFCELSGLLEGSFVFHPQTSLEHGPSIQPLNDRHCFQKVPDFQGGYLGYSYLYDELPHTVKDTDRYVFPLQDDVQGHKEPLSLHMDDQENRHNNNLDLLFCLLSNQGVRGHYGGLDVGFLYDFFYRDQTHISHLCQDDDQPPNVSGRQPQSSPVFSQSAIETLYYIFCNIFELSCTKPQIRLQPISLFSSQSLSDNEFYQVEDFPLLKSPLGYLQIISIDPIRKDVKWDFEVPMYHNYYHAGIIHHNCGKTMGVVINYIFRIMGWHPIPKRNVLYFECPELVKEEKMADKDGDDSCINHPWVTRVFSSGEVINIHREGQYIDSAIYPKNYPKRYSKSVRPKDNICAVCGSHLEIHKRKSRIFRFGSEVLPGEKENITGEEMQSTEIKNAVYPEFKKWFPPFLIKKDITARRPAMTLYDPNSNCDFGDIKYKGADIVLEFVAYHQTVQSGAGVQRLSCYIDEESPYDFYEEQMPRLVAEDGDLIITLTPANRLSYMFDMFFEKAQMYIRTKSICNFLLEYDKKEVKKVEITDNDSGIVVYQAATDDNPTLSKKAIEKKYVYDDPDTVATRRYGIFRQTSGRIFNDFDYKIHVIDFLNYFNDGMVPA